MLKLAEGTYLNRRIAAKKAREIYLVERYICYNPYSLKKERKVWKARGKNE
jgi:hypothetical protein